MRVCSHPKSFLASPKGNYPPSFITWCDNCHRVHCHPVWSLFLSLLLSICETNCVCSLNTIIKHYLSRLAGLHTACTSSFLGLLACRGSPWQAGKGVFPSSVPFVILSTFRSFSKPSPTILQFIPIHEINNAVVPIQFSLQADLD